MYVIKSSLLTGMVTDRFRKGIYETIDLYLKGEDYTQTCLVEWANEVLDRGEWWYGCNPKHNREAAIKKRLRKVIKLYRSLKKKGYDGTPFTVLFNKKTGEVLLYDGFHRVVLMEYLNLEVDVNVKISNRDPVPSRRGDFPLVKVLMRLNKGKNLYQPVADSRLAGFNVWRKDCPKRLAYILKHIDGKTVLDIGCCEGYFTRELAQRGFKVTAIDANPLRVAVTRYLSIINNLEVTCETAALQTYLDQPIHFDNILFLSVFHHIILVKGAEQAFKTLQKFRGKADRVFMETPISTRDINWIDVHAHKKYRFSEQQFKTRLEEAMQMKVKNVWHGTRPMFLLEAVT